MIGCTDWAAGLARELVAPRSIARWRHTIAVAEKAHRFSDHLPLRDAHDLVSAALLHDIGHARHLHRTGFHPLDGAVYLRSTGLTRVADLVANHSGAATEGRLRGLAAPMSDFPPERTFVADALTYCDITTDADGTEVSLETRLEGVLERYGTEHIVTRAFMASFENFVACIARVTTAVQFSRTRLLRNP